MTDEKVWVKKFGDFPQDQKDTAEEALEKKVIELLNDPKANKDRVLHIVFNALLWYPGSLNLGFLVAIHRLKRSGFHSLKDQVLTSLHTLQSQYKHHLEADDEDESFDLIFKVLDEMLVHLPNNKECLNLRGIFLFIVKKVPEALKAFDLASLVDEQWPLPLLNKSGVHRFLKNYDEVLAIFEKLKECLPNDPVVRMRKGDFHIKILQLDQAKREYEAAIELDKKCQAHCFASTGWIYFLQKDFSTSRHWLDKAILENEDDPMTNWYLGGYFAYFRKLPEALTHYKNFRRITSSLLDVDNRIKHIKSEKGIIENETLKFPENSKNLTRFEIDNYLWSIVCLFQSGHFKPCLDFLLNLEENHYFRPEIHIFLAKTYVFTGNFPAAVSELEKGLLKLSDLILKQKHFSQLVQEYKVDVFRKERQVFQLMIEVIQIDFDPSVISIKKNINDLFDAIFGLFKNKFLLKYAYLKDETDFVEGLSNLRTRIDSLKSNISDKSSSLFLPSFIQSDNVVLAYYHALLRDLLSFEDFSTTEGNLQTSAGEGIAYILNNLDPLYTMNPQTCKIDVDDLMISPANMNKFDSESAIRRKALTDIAKLLCKINGSRIKAAQSSKEIRMFAKEGCFVKYSQFFSKEDGSPLSSNLEKLAKIDALKIMFIVYRGSFEQNTAMNHKINQIADLSKVAFTAPKRKKKWLCFK
jgi:tetratricopeptide (TPR) repeat protein